MMKWLMWAGAAALLALGLGFWSFAERVRQAPPDPPPHAQAVVALTGGSQERLNTGVRLLRQAAAQRLFISGVNPDVTDAELDALLEIEPALAACCVEFGRAAEDTIGNAAETAAWARGHGVNSLILVTDDYHMPRSLAELKLAMPGTEIAPYPVRTRWTDPAVWGSDPDAAVKIGAEYLKYLVIVSREFLIGLRTDHAQTEKAGHV
jgi:uncharacterized SAM-binding protein YcdF (DUF218 family)